jgi:hypothetical protein
MRDIVAAPEIGFWGEPAQDTSPANGAAAGFEVAMSDSPAPYVDRRKGFCSGFKDDGSKCGARRMTDGLLCVGHQRSADNENSRHEPFPPTLV